MEKKEKEVEGGERGGGAAVGADELLKLASSLSITSTKVEDSEFAIIRALRRPIRRVLYANNAESKIHLSLSPLSFFLLSTLLILRILRYVHRRNRKFVFFLNFSHIPRICNCS